MSERNLEQEIDDLKQQLAEIKEIISPIISIGKFSAVEMRGVELKTIVIVINNVMIISRNFLLFFILYSFSLFCMIQSLPK